jgi:hypothetical protein
MKSKFKLLLFVLVTVLFATTACDKEDDEPTKTDLITKAWKVISIDGDPVDEVEILLKFEVNGNLILQSIDDDGESFTVALNWAWAENETKINISMFGEQLIWKLDKLTTDILWIYDEEDSLIKLVPNK